MPGLLYGVLTIAVETPILWFGLAHRHPWRDRVLAGIWLSTCTWPVVAYLLPAVVDPWSHRTAYLWIAETFAPLAECALFQAAFGMPRRSGRGTAVRDCAVIVVANVVSFLVGVMVGSG